jgi:ribosomal protein L40E
MPGPDMPRPANPFFSVDPISLPEPSARPRSRQQPAGPPPQAVNGRPDEGGLPSHIPTRVVEEEQSAAQELRTQSQAWKSGDDGWNLWPLGDDPAKTEMALTPEELELVQAQLRQPSSRDDQDRQPGPAQETFPPLQPAHASPGVPDLHAAPEAQAPAEAPRTTGRRRSAPPETAAAVRRPAPDEPVETAPSSFDLLGSLRQPVEYSEPPAAEEPRRQPVIGRLLGRHQPSAEPVAPAPPAPAKPAKPAKSRKQAASTAPVQAWPTPTRWLERPIEYHDWWGDDAQAADGQASPEAAGGYEVPAQAVPAAPEHVTQTAPSPAWLLRQQDPAGTGAAPRPPRAPARPAAPAPAAPAPGQPERPAAATEAPSQEVPAPAQPAAAAPAPPVAPPQPAAPAPIQPPIPAAATPAQPALTLPPATTVRWPAPAPDIPARAPAEWPPADPHDARWLAAQQRSVESGQDAPRETEDGPAWPPIGASWPAQKRPAAPWPIPSDTVAAAGSMPARPADQGDSPESPLVAALWAESAQQVLDRGGVRVCHRCSLPVSTHAHFCRRCGTRQD